MFQGKSDGRISHRITLNHMNPIGILILINAYVQLGQNFAKNVSLKISTAYFYNFKDDEIEDQYFFS